MQEFTLEYTINSNCTGSLVIEDEVDVTRSRSYEKHNRDRVNMVGKGQLIVKDEA